MAEEFLDLSQLGTEKNKTKTNKLDRGSGRDAVRILLLGQSSSVQQVIQDLYLCRFCEVGVWSKPLTIAESPPALTLNPGEVMRIYKRYLTR